MFSYIKKQVRSTKHAVDGLGVMLNDYNAFIHVPSAILAILFGFAFQISSTEWIFILSAIASVWITEILNTALEKLVDLVSPKKNKIAGQVKDLAAGAVLIAALYALVVGIIIFGERLSLLFINS